MFTTALTYLPTRQQLKFLKIELTKTQAFWISKKDDEKIQFLQNLRTTSDVKLTIQTLEIWSFHASQSERCIAKRQILLLVGLHKNLDTTIQSLMQKLAIFQDICTRMLIFNNCLIKLNEMILIQSTLNYFKLLF